jgi:hypothetical protein
MPPAFTLNVPAGKKPATTKTAVAPKTAAALKTTATSKPAASKTADTETADTTITKNLRKRPAATLSTAAVLGKKARTRSHKSTETVDPADMADDVPEEEDEV